MGHRDSSTALSGAGALRAAGGGARPAAAQHQSRSLTLAARMLLAAVRVYHVFFSAWMPSACKFYPSCSQYAAIAVQLHGARHGSWLAMRRLARCHPFTRGGVDLVPDAMDCPCEGNAAAQTPIFKKAGNTGARNTCRRHSARSPLAAPLWRASGASAACTPTEDEVRS
jgi:putative membrane protein insertion efficiency factor